MTPMSSAARVDRASNNLPPNDDQRDALRRVGERLLIIADNPSVNWTEQGRIDARRIGAEMLRQCGDDHHHGSKPEAGRR
jgi:hypothetical protein